MDDYVQLPTGQDRSAPAALVHLTHGKAVGLGDYVEAILGLGDDYIGMWTDVNGVQDRFVHIT
jgi:hypothetical protein